MNKVKTVMWMSVRTYVRKLNAGFRTKIMLAQEGNKDEIQIDESDFENNDFEDVNEFESDFANAHIYHKMHEREVYKMKENLKNKITRTKYFKESNPSFLTFAEKEQIRMLHDKDPKEWTIEKLSEGFPALPSTIIKILKSKWHPKSVNKIMKQDSVVAENWKLFRAGTLQVDPQLRLHLMKFKDRKIIMTNRETLAKKLIPPEIELPKPKSTLFSHIVEGYIGEKENNHIKGEASLNASHSNVPTVTKIEDTNTENDGIETLKFNTIIPAFTPRKNLDTFSSFVKKQINKPFEGSKEEKITLIDVYKKQIADKKINDETMVDKQNHAKMINHVPELTVTEVSQANVSVHPKHECNDKNVNIKNTTNNKDISTISNIDYTDIDKIKNKGSNELSTYIVSWTKKTETDVDYTLPIKIPKNFYKEGMTYRIKDCYYDDNGQFLFRVPGLRN